MLIIVKAITRRSNKSMLIAVKTLLMAVFLYSKGSKGDKGDQGPMGLPVG